MQGTALEKCTVINDLGILLDDKLNMTNHFKFVLNKARRIWGFVKKQSKDFVDPYVTKSLYCSLVRPHFEYFSTVCLSGVCVSMHTRDARDVGSNRAQGRSKNRNTKI